MFRLTFLRLPKSSYIVSPIYDWVGFIGAPLIALLLGMGIYYRMIPDESLRVGYFSGLFWEFLVLILMTQCHLFITVVRAYGNSRIFSLFKWRLLLVPPIILLMGFFSQWFLIVQIVVNTWWDAYHSACQTFGFSRMYDIRMGNRSNAMRRMDRCLNVLIYMGPILGGATLLDHLATFEHFSLVGMLFLADVPFYANAFSQFILVAILLFSGGFIPFYLFKAWQYSKIHPVSFQKVWLLSITAVVSLLAWGFNSFGTAFIIANFFHAWQYYAMMYWSEKTALIERFQFKHYGASFFVLLFFIVISLIFGGFVVFVIDPLGASRLGVCFLATVATCHFWFDGFIWSVRKEHV